jgi:hypothetical protein
MYIQIDNYKVDPELKSGPISKRSCTDVLFAIFFVIFLCGMGASAIYGWHFGNPDMLMIGWDSDQNGCGYSEKTADYPYLYWPQSPDTAMLEQIQKGEYTNVV